MMDDKLMNDTRSVWERLAAFWDDSLKEGNDFQKRLIMPATDRLLGVVQGQTILDACCGNGNYARVLASRGATVVAFDGAPTFIERARQRTSPDLSITYTVMDATDHAALLELGINRFDAVVCSMALMDLPTIEPLFQATRKLLKPTGRFVFSVCHPAFNSPRHIHTAELISDNGKTQQRFGVKTEYYLTEYETLSEGLLHQPEPHPIFHRPISGIFNRAFEAGFVVDGFEEPSFPYEKSANAFSFAKRPEIPPALVVRLR
ncbi:MAG: hypothetical protein KatS3mg104_1593 [Phycisphaerae bacterium]|jgi:2-polyprenyl-3-methyl-5-hydroxy-6-metoxy-1,4-benzoquinol methylase|nr:MAG: hypothetical protein KatS3mg104_1593 [Phycisphaerae bacterium]